jgi:hypothetical protein
MNAFGHQVIMGNVSDVRTAYNGLNENQGPHKRNHTILYKEQIHSKK